ncbi:MAG: TIGR03560 family F420-dependent LLM class oxidoreductase [Leptolinea sp.]|jgi:F420-dependent oxidoreductase-like protein|nr:TIGR03560 family F420-dependent LLM class oxidoreductase [Leptolinea sp.]
MELAINVEGQNGLNWDNWKRIVLAAEELGFAGIFRSDHFSSFDGPPDLDALECWVSLTWLAGNTRRVQFGPLVTPVTFRHPAITARMAANLDDLSGGRLVLGLGTGWAEREHAIWGLELGDMKTRFQRFEEGLELIYRLFHETSPVTLNGQFYSVHDAQLLPRPKRAGGPIILVGGQGGKKTLSLAVRYADEWNTFLMPAADAVQLSKRLDEALAEAGRDPSSIWRSIMLNVVVGKTDADVKRKMGGMTEAECRAIGVIGTANAVADQLAEYAAAGLYRVVAQMNDLNDMDFLEILGTQVIPQIK